MRDAGPAHSGALWSTVARTGFPIVLWFIATFFLLGDLGRWNDDWFFVQRVPETGEIRSLVLDREVHFWRPLYRVVVPALCTLLWEHTAWQHLISAVAHGANAWLLYRLLFRLGVRRFAASVSALLFMVFPWHAEVVFWLCNLPTALSVSAMLGAMHLAVARPLAKTSAAVTLLTFIACCFNEQPAILACAFPVLVWCGQVNGRSRAWTAALFLVLPLVAVALYTKLHTGHSTTAMDIGAGRGMLHPAEWPGAAGRFAVWVGRYILEGYWLTAAWEHGVRAVRGHFVTLFVCLPLLAGLSMAWIVSMARSGHVRSARVHTGGMAPLALLGLVALLAPLAPIVAFDYWFVPRCLYPATIGLAILLAAGLTAMTSRLRGPIESYRASRAALASLAGVGLTALALAMVGVQHGYQQRSVNDRALLEQVKGAMPNPARGSVFVPVRVEAPRVKRGGAWFEHYYACVFNSWWAAGPSVRLGYRRADLDAGHAAWGRSAGMHPAVDGVRVAGVGRTRWELVVPLEIDSRNTVRLVTRVRFVNAEGVERVIRVPQTAALVDAGVIPEREHFFKDAPPNVLP